VIPADEDPRLSYASSASNGEQPPAQDAENFPALNPNATPDIRTEEDGSNPKRPARTYSDAVNFRINILVRVPPEIRAMIWEYHLPNDPEFNEYIPIRYCVGLNCDPARPHFLHPLWVLSKVTRDETVAVYMRHLTFILTSMRDTVFFRKFIATVQDGPKHVRELHFTHFDFFPDMDMNTGQRILKNSGLELAVDCTGLQTVLLRFGRCFLGTDVLDNNTQ
jgi:hypothetical protein